MKESSVDVSLAELQSRLKDLELSKTHDNMSEILQKERSEMLISLRKIMAALKTEALDGCGSGGGASSKEIEALKAENEELRKINAKQQYRIEHLVHNLRVFVHSNGK
ncbi:hypothetical protein HJC23_001457 [Cyclotella cryptica]|uniref:Uncharacterized protein n=1 Tax=Cyclotella cryptica TaxID=29204 RepID=A0ABD3PA37_9STRA|eukprot:CCRYP_016163-RA/>CCRYP_016163-RA protein AED:0.01 eAED:-0.01 QI:0/-1/0/1/-1/1/1/0/107